MTIQWNEWQPDSCTCHVAYQWDDSVPAETRTHTLHHVIKIGDCHTASDPAKIFDTLLEESRRQNSMRNLMAKQLGLTSRDNLQLKKSFDANRVLHIGSPLLKREDIQALQQTADQTHGAGKVVVG